MSVSSSVNITELIDRCPLGPLQIRIIVLCGLVALLEGFDGGVISVAAPAMAGPLHIAPNQFGAVFSAAVLGLILGGFVLGPMADRYAVGQATPPTALVIVILGLVSFFLGVATSGLIALTTLLYSTPIRSTGVGWPWDSADSVLLSDRSPLVCSSTGASRLPTALSHSACSRCALPCSRA
jgi:MFS family permease